MTPIKKMKEDDQFSLLIEDSNRESIDRDNKTKISLRSGKISRFPT